MTDAVTFRGVSRHFGIVKAVDEVDLSIRDGEFFAMLGPSGSGKTTCLRLIAGFEQPTAGHIEIFGERAEGVPPYLRNVNTVFQNYALFPHMNVRDNVAFGLRVKGVGRAERHRAAEEALELVELGGYGNRRAGELSGGQRQRVALARALVNKPRVVLLDEPLGALDLKLREQMQEELRKLQRALGLTFVFVTHDQDEALSMADRVAVFAEGKIQQVGTSEDIYRRPNTRFVADFVGSSNVLPADLVGAGASGQWASLRPEDVVLDASGREATVTGRYFHGRVTKLSLDLAGQSLTALIPARENAPEIGETTKISWDPARVHVMGQGA
ncbi:polyamine ABC transporter ATP-binding protein [Celeribacter ethanolicus]|uniref:Polyamine ABC transporter ATP-binding protein n=1 Tax=Celeribacter ethanolicus TaxID=1758178 RepID=A0A291GEI1_9RHOB|nr:ABC transporter ATP-binding protein [Celeribacter ethanolicus]ATG48591.1 polyamine ABC transporter ATP-binding protein [Celeribacter ethanolicus]